MIVTQYHLGTVLPITLYNINKLVKYLFVNIFLAIVKRYIKILLPKINKKDLYVNFNTQVFGK